MRASVVGVLCVLVALPSVLGAPAPRTKRLMDDPEFWEAARNATVGDGRQWLLNSMQSAWNSANLIGYTEGACARIHSRRSPCAGTHLRNTQIVT